MFCGTEDYNAMHLLGNKGHLLKVWLTLVKTSVIRDMAFRTSFILGIVRQILWLGTFIFMISVIFHNAPSLAGWSQPEVLIILALSRLIEGLMVTLFIDNLMMFPSVVHQGQFDSYLTKPLPVQFYTAFRQFGVSSIGNVVGGLILLLYGLYQIGNVPSVMQVLFFILLAFSGVTIYYSLLIMTASLVFFLDRFEAMWGFNILFSEPLTVPFDAFPRLPRLALTYLIPVAFVVFVPAQALTNRLSWWQVPLALGLASLFLLLANLAWRAGLRRYTSASS